MTEKEKVAKSSISPDWFMRGALTKIGDTLDAITGRRWVPSSTLATSELIERTKRLLDSEAKEVAGKGLVAPHNIKLKMQWDKFSTDSEGALENLRNELLAAAADHINDSLYYTYAPLHVEVKPDYFTEGVKLYVGFDIFADEETEKIFKGQVSRKLPPTIQKTARRKFVPIAAQFCIIIATERDTHARALGVWHTFGSIRRHQHNPMISF